MISGLKVLNEVYSVINKQRLLGVETQSKFKLWGCEVNITHKLFIGGTDLSISPVTSYEIDMQGVGDFMRSLGSDIRVKVERFHKVSNIDYNIFLAACRVIHIAKPCILDVYGYRESYGLNTVVRSEYNVPFVVTTPSSISGDFIYDGGHAINNMVLIKTKEGSYMGTSTYNPKLIKVSVSDEMYDIIKSVFGTECNGMIKANGITFKSSKASRLQDWKV